MNTIMAASKVTINNIILPSLVEATGFITGFASANFNVQDLFYVLLTLMMIVMTILSYFLNRSLKKLKHQKDEISYFSQLHKTFFDADKSLIYLKDDSLRYILINKAVELFYSKPESDIIGFTDFDISEEEFASLRRKTDEDVIKQHKILVDEFQWKSKVYETTKFPVKLPNGRYGIGAYKKEVTEQYNNKLMLEETIRSLKEQEAKLQLILDTTGEAIYGIDRDGICTFCNKSCLRMLRYDKIEDMVGKNTHWLFHRNNKEGNNIAIEDCKVLGALNRGEGTHADDVVFWRSDGTCFDVEYFSYPQYKGEELIGAVVTFMDISDRKIKEEHINYLAYHDTLTDLYNRRFLEDKPEIYTSNDKLPVSVIMADVNGLKLTNDILGHEEGDKLLQNAAIVMNEVCRESDISVRLGGDEFMIILPNTDSDTAAEIANEIRTRYSNKCSKIFPCSISIGYDTKTTEDEDLKHKIQIAEKKMYTEKTLKRKEFSNFAIKKIIKNLYEDNPSEERHSRNVSRLCENMAKCLSLSKSEAVRLKEAAYLHDIGKIVLESFVLSKRDNLNVDEWQQLKQHPVIGYRILNFSDDTMDLAKYVLSHHEKWDGSGYPRGLVGKNIPKTSRIIALAESYDYMINDTPYRKAYSKEEAIQRISANSGKQFDPNLTDIFISMLQEMPIKP